jgi:hypothetical protein
MNHQIGREIRDIPRLRRGWWRFCWWLPILLVLAYVSR